MWTSNARLLRHQVSEVARPGASPPAVQAPLSGLGGRYEPGLLSASASHLTRLSPQPADDAVHQAPPMSSSVDLADHHLRPSGLPARYMLALPSTMMTMSQNAGRTCFHGRDGPNRAQYLQDRPLAFDLRGRSCCPGGSEKVTWSVMRAPYFESSGRPSTPVFTATSMMRMIFSTVRAPQEPAIANRVVGHQAQSGRRWWRERSPRHRLAVRRPSRWRTSVLHEGTRPTRPVDIPREHSTVARWPRGTALAPLAFTRSASDFRSFGVHIRSVAARVIESGGTTARQRSLQNPNPRTGRPR